MALHDGNGWVHCRCGLRHWGLFGAAGLALIDLRAGAALPPRGPRLLLQLRSDWTHQGGTWGLPGGARDSHEDVVGAALREACEEVGVGAEEVVVLAQHPGADHGDWSYTYVLALAGAGLRVEIRTAESDDLRWVTLDDVPRLPLHPALETAWAGLRRAVEHLLVSDVTGRDGP